MTEEARTDDVRTELHEAADSAAPYGGMAARALGVIADQGDEIDRLRAELDRTRVAGDAMADDLGVDDPNAGEWRAARGDTATERTDCVLCGHDPSCGYATNTAGELLCHSDSHSCYTAWTRDGKRPAAAPTDGQAPADEAWSVRISRGLTVEHTPAAPADDTAPPPGMPTICWDPVKRIVITHQDDDVRVVENVAGHDTSRTVRLVPAGDTAAPEDVCPHCLHAAAWPDADITPGADWHELSDDERDAWVRAARYAHQHYTAVLDDDTLVAAMAAAIEPHHPSPDDVDMQLPAVDLARELLPVVRAAARPARDTDGDGRG